MIWLFFHQHSTNFSLKWRAFWLIHLLYFVSSILFLIFTILIIYLFVMLHTVRLFAIRLLFSCYVMSDSLRPHGLRQASLPGSSLSPRVCLNSYPLIQWCYLIISSSATLFSFCLQTCLASGSFPMSQLFSSGSQSIGTSASVSVLPMNIQGWFPLGLTGLISLLSKGLSRVFPSIIVWKHQFFGTQPSLWSSSPLCMTTGKTIALTRWTFVGKVMFLLLNSCLGLS